MKPFLLPLLFIAATLSAQNKTVGYIPVSNGGQIYYEAEGEGEPVILLHGHTLDLRMWDPQMPYLLAGNNDTLPDGTVRHISYRVIRPEMRGYGHSSKQEEDVPYTHLDDMMTVMDSLHLERAHVVGLSMGSFVASEMVAMHPERLITATLASGNIRNRKGPHTPMTADELDKLQQQLDANRAKGLDRWKKDWIESLIKGGGSRQEEIRASITEQINDWDGWQCFHNEGRNYYGDEATDSLKARRPQIPVLILSGEKEHKTVPNPMLQYLPQGRQIVISDCGHMSNMEQPEMFSRLVLEQLLK